MKGPRKRLFHHPAGRVISSDWSTNSSKCFSVRISFEFSQNFLSKAPGKNSFHGQPFWNCFHTSQNRDLFLRGALQSVNASLICCTVFQRYGGNTLLYGPISWHSPGVSSSDFIKIQQPKKMQQNTRDWSWVTETKRFQHWSRARKRERQRTSR